MCDQFNQTPINLWEESKAELSSVSITECFVIELSANISVCREAEHIASYFINSHFTLPLIADFIYFFLKKKKQLFGQNTERNEP